MVRFYIHDLWTFSAVDSTAVTTGGARQTAGGGTECCEESGVSDETMFGMLRSDI